MHTGGIGRLLDKVLLVALHGFLVHPHEHGLEVAADVWQIVGVDKHFTARKVDFVFEGEGYGLGRESLFEFSVVGYNRFDTRFLA